jgi:hypothetical protein
MPVFAERFAATPFRRALLLQLPLSGKGLGPAERQELIRCCSLGLVALSGTRRGRRFVLMPKGRMALAAPPAQTMRP